MMLFTDSRWQEKIVSEAGQPASLTARATSVQTTVGEPLRSGLTWKEFKLFYAAIGVVCIIYFFTMQSASMVTFLKTIWIQAFRHFCPDTAMWKAKKTCTLANSILSGTKNENHNRSSVSLWTMPSLSSKLTSAEHREYLRANTVPWKWSVQIVVP